jgi:hypothetical protein
VSDQLATIDDAMNLQLVGDPAKIIEQAEKTCKVLMAIVKKRQLYTDIGKARHLKVEAWLLCAHFFGVTPRVVCVNPVVDEMTGCAGFEATVEALHLQSGRVIGQAIARCLNNEENWGMRPKYERQNGQRKQVGEVATPSFQLESMAQTRATSKVLASLFRWVVILGGGGVEGTPAEEMTGDRQSEEGETTQHGGKRISEPQRKRIFAIAKELGYPMNDLPQNWIKHGFENAAEITIDKYDSIVTEIQNYKGA